MKILLYSFFMRYQLVNLAFLSDYTIDISLIISDVK